MHIPRKNVYLCKIFHNEKLTNRKSKVSIVLKQVIKETENQYKNML